MKYTVLYKCIRNINLFQKTEHEENKFISYAVLNVRLTGYTSNNNDIDA